MLKGHWAALEVVVAEFEKEAARIVKILVGELSLSDKEKTIKQISAGGVAGGQKFIESNIFLKFSFDHVGMFGGNDQLAAKAASRELFGLGVLAELCVGKRFLQNGKIMCAPPVCRLNVVSRKKDPKKISQVIKGLSVPLAITIDYLGFRVSASTLLPIGVGTLMLGSEGTKVHLCSPFGFESLKMGGKLS